MPILTSPKLPVSLQLRGGNLFFRGSGNGGPHHAERKLFNVYQDCH